MDQTKIKNQVKKFEEHLIVGRLMGIALDTALA